MILYIFLIITFLLVNLNVCEGAKKLLADDIIPTHALIRTCQQCKLTKTKFLKTVLDKQLDIFSNIKIDYVKGHNSVIKFYDENDIELIESYLPDMTLYDLIDFFNTSFNFRLKEIHYYTVPEIYKLEPLHVGVHGNYMYEFFPIDVTFYQAQQIAKLHGGFLPIIDNYLLNEFLPTLTEREVKETLDNGQKLVKKVKSEIWLGAQDHHYYGWTRQLTPENNFHWTEHFGISMPNYGAIKDQNFKGAWSENEPNNAYNIEHCVIQGIDAKWNDVSCYTFHHLMIQYEIDTQDHDLKEDLKDEQIISQPPPSIHHEEL